MTTSYTTDRKRAPTDGGKAGAGGKKLKKDKVTSGTGKGSKSEAAAAAAPAHRAKAELPMPIIAEEVERQALEDLRNRVRLGSTALPSVSFYSFINTHNSGWVLGCWRLLRLLLEGWGKHVTEVSIWKRDTPNLVSLQFWDMAKIGEQAVAAEHGSMNGNTKAPSDGATGAAIDQNKTAYTLFQGHSGPVYAANFSPDGNFLLSASADYTVHPITLHA